MDNLQVLLIVLGVVLGVGGTVFLLFPKLKEKNIEVEPILNKATTVLEGIDAILNVTDKLLPNNAAVNVLKTIEKYSTIAVHQAEQLYVASKIDKVERNIKAKETIYAALKTLGIERNEDIDTIIDGAIEAEVLALGHKDKSEAEKQAEKEQLQSKLQEKIQQNEQLKQTLKQVQSTVNTVQ